MKTAAAGGRAVSYAMRAETPGDFPAKPARVFNMDRPEIGGRSAESRIKVVERRSPTPRDR